MPSTLVAGLVARLRAVQASVGTGEPSTAALSGLHDALAGIAVAADGSWAGTRWVGDGAAASGEFTRETVAAVRALATRTERLAVTATEAEAAVTRARVRLRAIVDDFEARAAELEARLDEPGAAEELAAEARRALDEAEGVVEELRAQIETHRAAVAAPTGPESKAVPTTPMGPMPGMGALSGLGSAIGGGAGLGSGPGARAGTGSGLASALRSGAAGDAPSGLATEPPPTVDPGVFGSGASVQLPDGSTATAPNAVAAEAVRNALTQLGVPYDWGGTSPGRGLDCSGLTQWAYHEAGLDLPRLAQEQDVGAAVGRASLRPGDLAVWDGHVAMVVGNGLMIEAGSPVKLSAIRTTNAGQGFQGFWRPTA